MYNKIPKQEISKKDKNYIYINWILLVLAIYVIFFPFIAKKMSTILPQMTRCPYLSVTGKPCPLCGGTRYLATLYQGGQGIKYLFHPFGIIALVVIVEILFRMVSLTRIYRQRKISKKWIVIDIIIHALYALFFIGYEVWFFINSK